MPLQPSDRKKLLALPFAMTKRSEKPEPRKGQASYDLFKEVTGRDWHEDSLIRDDKEYKITEFDYENYLNAGLLQNVDTNSQEFKDLVRWLNYTSKTNYEHL